MSEPMSQQDVVDDAVNRVGVALGALGDLIAAAGDPKVLERPPMNLDTLAGLDGEPGSEANAAERTLKGLGALLKAAKEDPEGLRALGERVAARWTDPDRPEVADGVRAAVVELTERESV